MPVLAKNASHFFNARTSRKNLVTKKLPKKAIFRDALNSVTQNRNNVSAANVLNHYHANVIFFDLADYAN